MKTAHQLLMEWAKSKGFKTPNDAMTGMAKDSFWTDIMELFGDYERQSKWIPVTERLPEIATEVNVLTKAGRVTSLCRLIPYEGAPEWYWDNAYGGKNWHIAAEVTHWQPLPEKP